MRYAGKTRESALDFSDVFLYNESLNESLYEPMKGRKEPLERDYNAHTRMIGGFPQIRKRGIISPCGETTPFVWMLDGKETLMREELYDPTRGTDPNVPAVCMIRNAETGEILSRFGEDCYYYSFYDWRKNMKHLTRTLLSALSLLAVLSAAACGGETSEVPAETKPSAPVSEEAASDAPLSFPDTIPADAYYNGAEFRIAYSNAWEMNECVYTLDDAAGDLVNEAVYQRNLKTEEKLGIRISGDRLCKWDEIAVNLQKMVQAGDCPYDILMASEVQLFRASLNNLLLDMSGIDTLDLTHSWWDTEALDMYSLGTKNRFLVSGTVNYLDDYSQNCLLFNKKLCAQYDLEEPYALVREGKWTFDRFMEYVMKFGIDLDGDGKMNENDLYGYLGNVGAINNFLYGAGEGIITFDAEGNADLNTSDRMQTNHIQF